MVNYLKSQGVKSLQVLVATHPHADHIGGLPEVIRSFPIEKIYMPKVVHNSEQFANLLQIIKEQGLRVKTARAGVALPLTDMKAVFIAPVNEGYEDLNNYSAVIKMEYGKNAFILAGDAESLSEAEMINSKIPLKAQVLKVGHHAVQAAAVSLFCRLLLPNMP
ncbi:MBL fold metallo-hydrolase [Syntrophomonas palmitatica]|uniref:MBL fold metallo-hydrolase n=1 Tax=Syntrophomonas palmitatica TaxID=402877 RepID=UPI0006D2ADC7|nr:MBL fold metallo-hydrolase [Syntrophomonas palmitatica]